MEILMRADLYRTVHVYIYHCAINVCSECGDDEIKEEQQPSPPGMKPGQPSLLPHVTISLLRSVIITQSKEKLYSSVINTQPCMQLRCENIHNNYSVMQYEQKTTTALKLTIIISHWARVTELTRQISPTHEHSCHGHLRQRQYLKPTPLLILQTEDGLLAAWNRNSSHCDRL